MKSKYSQCTKKFKSIIREKQELETRDVALQLKN